MIFTGAYDFGLQCVKKLNYSYCRESGQLINTHKVFFIVHDSCSNHQIPIISRTLGFVQQALPFTYLGVPLYRGNKKTELFLPLIHKMKEHLSSWDKHYLVFGGRLALIKPSSRPSV